MADARYDGWSAEQLCQRLALPRVELRGLVTSTLDVAHELARAGAAAGTLVLAEEQSAGRGRGGKTWVSEPGAGVWLTLIERPRHADVVDVLAIRLGLAAASALEPWALAPVGLKWPNDVLAGGAKLAGVLVETRWREASPDWVAVGLGVNVRQPGGVVGTAALRPGVRRTEILARLVPALRQAAARRGALTQDELAAWAARDAVRGRRCREPARGVVAGIDAAGALLVRTAAGLAACRSGSLVLEEDT